MWHLACCLARLTNHWHAHLLHSLDMALGVAGFSQVARLRSWCYPGLPSHQHDNNNTPHHDHTSSSQHNTPRSHITKYRNTPHHDHTSLSQHNTKNTSGDENKTHIITWSHRKTRQRQARRADCTRRVERGCEPCIKPATGDDGENDHVSDALLTTRESTSTSRRVETRLSQNKGDAKLKAKPLKSKSLRTETQTLG